MLLHWLGAVFDPSLRGYWGSERLDAAADTVVELIGRADGRVAGVKLSVLDASAERALRASLTSLSEGFTRENAELAALLIDRHRPGEAIPLVRLALQGPMESSNAYITRTELQALLARAYTAAGQADSAAAYRAAARRAWRGGSKPPALACDRAGIRRESRAP